MSRHDPPLQDKLAHYLLRSLNKAIRDYGMIQSGDRIAVAVSGGRDSLTMLNLLRLRQQSCADEYQIMPVHVVMCRPGAMACVQPDPSSALKSYLESQSLACALEIVATEEQPTCFRCSYLRRKALFSAAQRLSCNKIALGHHADDAAQTTLLNLAFHGKVETLSPCREFFDGQFTVIRPMIYVPEKRIACFAQAAAFPALQAGCPHSTTSRRALARHIVHLLEQEYPRVKINLFRAGLKGQPPATENLEMSAELRPDVCSGSSGVALPQS